MGAPKLCCRNTEADLKSERPLLQRFSCGAGHVMNDITHQLLFSFRLVFFMKVLGLSAAITGWLTLLGLITVGASAPLTAFLVDKINIPLLSRKLGRRKSWHLIGTVIGVIVIPLFFTPCFLCPRDGGEWQKIMYIATLNAILSFAVSLMEIGHLSIIAVIAKDQGEAVELNAWRFVTVVMYIYCQLLYCLKKSGKNKTNKK